MKKLAFALILLAAIGFQSCKVRTCPTYAKTNTTQTVNQVAIAEQGK